MQSNQEQHNKSEKAAYAKNAKVKDVYQKPAIDIIEMETEGILCSSAPGFGDGGDVF